MPDDPITAQQTVIGLLGPVTVAGVEVAGVRAKRLLVSLALAGGRARSADRLIDDIWGDLPPKSPQSALHTQISRLRHLLDDGSIAGVGSGYRLDGVTTDLDLVENALAKGDSLTVDEAASLWRGAPGDDLGADDELAQELRRRAHNLAGKLDDVRGASALRERDYVTARELAEKRCTADPLDESAHILLMKALAGEGRRGEALAVFSRLRRALATELGVDPGSEATALNAELLSDADSPSSMGLARRGKTSGLRAESTPLVGRDDDLRTIIDLLDANRVVTVLGPGGVGKTRIANAVGNEYAAQGKTVHFVPLASVRDDADVVAALATALGVGETDMSASGRPRLAVGELADRLADAVRGRPTLLILDNCEQVIDSVARVVADLIATEPELSVVATSRSPLLIAAEQVYPLPVLRVDGANSSAVELFVMRARSVRPTADLPTDKVAELCTHLDGLPLAIELAAARIRAMTVDEITQRLVARFDLLRSGDRTAPDRHRTLHAVIEWSWDLLDDAARGALRRMCRFPAGFGVDAAATVLGCDGAELDDTLDALVNQSLLEVTESGGRVRYRMLEMVREFGEEKLQQTGEGGNVDDAMARWARAYSRSARAHYDESADRALIASMEEEAENLVWVLRRACEPSGAPDEVTIVTVFPAVAVFWAMRGLHAEVRSWGLRLTDLLPVPRRDLPDDLRELWQLTLTAACVHLLLQPIMRQLAKARWYLRRLHRPDRQLDQPMEFLSSILLSRSTYAGLRAIVLATRSANPEVRRGALALRMNLRENLGNLDGALRDGATLREISNPGDPWQAMIDVSTASIYGQQAHWQTALGFYRKGIAQLEEIGAEEDQMQARGYVVVTLIAMGDLIGAQRELDVLSRGWGPEDPDPQGNPEVIAGMMVCHGELARTRGESAAQLYWRAGDLLVREHPLVASDPGAVMVLSVIVIGLVLSGDGQRAWEFLSTVAEGVEATFAQTGWHDMPQAGAMALAAGLVVSSQRGMPEDGAVLMLVGKRLMARQDYPALCEVRARMRELSGLDDARWEAESARVDSMSRRMAIAELRRVLAKHTGGNRKTS
ncbi:putative AfsR family transcriptional regulator [Gordonia effusa NBRC 100432]|uniref:Putative AfsR family transcriptional regulator n=1 Tax=Gordonia effusa NBRC 100432 TaxID=1077974 RepID=H0R5V7_9ACTN|nr:BTAD domain-containing putative transcriptional regulator [Gordonia effusa]GAB20458.1 putative AfsR family transcriptional regulator [Gordonia effusa NBRC 100432]